ncbi:MAG: DotU family type IV/VI secretion system protein [Holosporales bacterium]|nr:DotU family type IV/VI secretion system protein [Holosporales bacterium]
MSFAANESAVVHGFQAFYYALLRQKERALSLYFSHDFSQDPDIDNDSTEEPDGESTKKQNEVEGAIVAIQKNLMDVINNSMDMIYAKSRLPHHLITDVKYIMTVLTDEIFINLRWDGAKYWRFSLLEKQFFQSEVAGDQFFKMLDEIVYNYDLHTEEMAFLYLMTLSLGFKGRYRDMDSANEHIAWYKDRLYSMLHSKSSRLFYPGRQHIIESCYEYTSTENNNSNLPDAKFWSWCIISVFVLYIIISYCVWYSITSDIDDVLKSIIEQTRQGPLV